MGVRVSPCPPRFCYNMNVDQETYLGLAFILITMAGFYLAYLYGHNTKRFLWREYIAIIIWPLICVGILTYVYGPKLITMFVASSLLGFVLEYILGLVYHKTLNSRLWTYHRLSMQGYTSLLSIPVWGIAGVIFFFIFKIVGL